MRPCPAFRQAPTVAQNNQVGLYLNPLQTPLYVICMKKTRERPRPQDAKHSQKGLQHQHLAPCWTRKEDERTPPADPLPQQFYSVRVRFTSPLRPPAQSSILCAPLPTRLFACFPSLVEGWQRAVEGRFPNLLINYVVLLAGPQRQREARSNPEGAASHERVTREQGKRPPKRSGGEEGGGARLSISRTR